MNKVIVTTTINPPTEALIKFSEMKGWNLVIAGDLKTPHEKYASGNWVYLHPATQELYDKKLSDLIGWNCIQRRNFAFLHAVKEMNADIIATIDDDNIPLSGWGENLMAGRETLVKYHVVESPVFDPIGFTNHPHLWHRGFPLEFISKRTSIKTLENITPDIQADFWNGDPDIDSICRMEHSPSCRFSDNCFPMASNKPSPFNSQNTFLSKRVMPHYFMFPGVGRYDDIIASYYVQEMGFKVVYGKASVEQRRNEHNLTKDFEDEKWGQPDCRFKTLPAIASEAFKQYQKHYE